jgi:tripartite-type tricarboxylate transporter receptor subunit TctC
MYKTFTRIIALLAFLGLYAPVDPVNAQDWPQRTIKLVVGFGAGGGTDIVARIVAQALQEKLGQSVVVENKVGGSGLIAADSWRNPTRMATRSTSLITRTSFLA